MAGKEFLWGFKERNPDFALTRKATSLIRTTGFDKNQVAQFYNILKLQQNLLIYIMPIKEETQLSIKTTKYCHRKKIQVVKLTSAEIETSLVFSMNATGHATVQFPNGKWRKMVPY